MRRCHGNQAEEEEYAAQPITVDASDVVPYVLTESCQCNALNRSSAFGAFMMVMTTRKAAAVQYLIEPGSFCCLQQT